MKKILGISLVALFAAMPMMAKADVLNAAKTIASDKQPTGDALTTQSYVKGAYNAALAEVRTVNDAVTLLNSAETAEGSVKHTIKTQAANADYISSATYDEGTIGYAIQHTTADAVDNLTTSVSTADTAALAVTVSQSAGLLTGVTASINDGAVTSEKISIGAVTSSKIADGTITAADIADSTITADKLATAVQTSLSHADSAYDAITAASTGLDSRVTAAESAIDLLNSNAQTAGSVDYKIANAISGAANVATGHYIQSGNTVAGNLQALDTAVYANESAISAVNSKQIPIVSSWSADSVTYTNISALPSGQTPVTE